MNKYYLFVLLLSVPPFTLNAQTLWNDVSLSLLGGSHYKVGENQRTIATFELASGHTWGDSFLFVDRIHPNDGKHTTYTEWSPRVTVLNRQNSVFENIYVASTIEAGDGFTHYLLGLGTNIKIPGFRFFKANVYHRNNDNKDNGSQITLAWAVPFGHVLYDGFIDYVPSAGSSETSMNFTSQLKYNLSSVLGLKTHLYVGVEYVYWNNKFGIEGIDERNINWLIKYHF